MTTLTATVTFFCGCVLCCSKQNKRTASGVKPVVGITIAAPRNIPFGTKVMVLGQEYIVQDRLSRKYPRRWDIYVGSDKDAHKRAKELGKIVTTIKIYK